VSDSIFDVIDRRFMSGNSVSVERVHIKSDEWTDLKYELFAARKENERVRQASLDVMMHFGDTKATKDKLEADLDRALARVADAIGSLETVSGKAELGASVARAERTETMNYVAEGFDVIKEYAQSEAARLRQQADQLEKAGGEE
jgi:hypothetical protein